jgi:hypothetical protein
LENDLNHSIKSTKNNEFELHEILDEVENMQVSDKTSSPGKKHFNNI